MPAPKIIRKIFNRVTVGTAMLMTSFNAVFGQMAEPQTNAPPESTGLKDRITRAFNASEVTSTGWAHPIYHFDSNTTLRTEVGYGDATPGLFVNHKFAEGKGEIDAGFMNFSQNVFPLGDTLSFNSKGNLYSNGEQTGDQLGLRYKNTFHIDETSRLEYAGFAGAAVSGFSPSVGVNADYHRDLGHNWHLLTGLGLSYLGERDTVTINGIAAVQKSLHFESFPDGKWTLGFQVKDEFGKDGVNRAIAFTEYQTHIVGPDNKTWLSKISALFSGYAGTDSQGGKVGVLYTPGKMNEGKKDFGVSFGPSVGWDTKQGGPQVNLELRAGF